MSRARDWMLRETTLAGIGTPTRKTGLIHSAFRPSDDACTYPCNIPGNLFAVAEAYPELNTNQQFLNLQTRISALDNAIADRREFYNDSVNVNNVRVEQFPDTVIARLFGFRQFSLLRFAAEEKKDVDLKATSQGGMTTADLNRYNVPTKLSGSQLTPKIGLNWQATPDVMLATCVTAIWPSWMILPPAATIISLPPGFS